MTGPHNPGCASDITALLVVLAVAAIVIYTIAGALQ